MLSSPIEEIKSRLDIVEVIGGYIKLQKAGVNYRAPCPFHSEKKPSFFVSPARQMWHCFGCGLGHNIFDFVMKIEGVEFGDALRILAQKAGVELTRQDPKLITERQKSLEVCELACRFFEKQLEESISGKKAKEYLLKRGVSQESIKSWRLGYSPDNWQGLSYFLVGRGYRREEIEKAGMALKSEKNNNSYDRFRGRIMFPIFDLSSQVIGFGGRVFKHKDRPDGQEEAKYINTPSTIIYDKSRVFYGLNKAGTEIRKNDFCILVEGYVDAIMAFQAGSKNIVACSGTALTPFQLKILKRYSENIFTAFDMDFAGNSATKRSIDLAQAMGFNIKVVTMEDDLDPADVVLKNPEDWEKAIKGAKSIYDFYFETAILKFGTESIDSKKEISKFLLPVIKKIPNEIEKSVWIQRLSEILKIKEEGIREELKKVIISKDERFLEEKALEAVEEKMTRKELLEENLAVSLSANKKNIGLLEKDDFLFLSPTALKFVNYIKESLDNQNAAVPQEISEFANNVFLKAEAGYFGGEPEEEVKECLKEIRFMTSRNKLTEISEGIKKAEKEGNMELAQKLMQEFNHFSKSISIN
jgi:DNA primase